MRSNGHMSPDADYDQTRRQERPRALPGPQVRLRDRVRSAARVDRDDGRSDLPVIGPDESPRRVARPLGETRGQGGGSPACVLATEAYLSSSVPPLERRQREAGDSANPLG